MWLVEENTNHGMLSSSVYGTFSTEQQYANGEISNANRWTNHAMTVISYLGPGGIAISVLYSAVFEDAIFKGKAPSFMPESYWEGSLFITFKILDAIILPILLYYTFLF